MFMQMRMKAPTWCLEGKGIGIRVQARGIAGKQNRGFFHFEKVNKSIIIYFLFVCKCMKSVMPLDNL